MARLKMAAGMARVEPRRRARADQLLKPRPEDPALDARRRKNGDLLLSWAESGA
jgi:hypothetical protein